ncbi:MAG: ADP-ribosylglycohydrolase family protein [Burkholderiaceae bacterium]|nr:ADP-ribosylglycohydrolase family protein [Burkholderiaceae bacterium]
MKTDTLDRYRGCLLGLACGDAVGTTVEFSPRGSFPPVVDMVGGGPFDLPAGAWTDDTSMALCLATSLVHSNGFDARDQMNRYVNWWQHGYLSSMPDCFDIGTTVCRALQRYQATGDPMAGDISPKTAGNGSLMRLAPVVLYYAPMPDEVRRYARLSSATTHAAPEALDSCELLGEVLLNALAGKPRNQLLPMHPAFASPKVNDLITARYRSKPKDDIADSGYCVESLEAALWCFDTTSTFETAILAASNLGDDADTTAAIVGQIAGAHYGVSDIPARWIERLHMADAIDRLAAQLFERAAPRWCHTTAQRKISP